MNTTEWLFAHPSVRALGWTLIHFIWQGALIATLFTFVSLLLRGQSANARYIAATASMLLMLAAPVVTLSYLALNVPPVTFNEQKPSAQTLTGEQEERPIMEEDRDESQPHLRGAASLTEPSLLFSSQQWVGNQFARVLPWLVLAWFGGVVMLTLRLGRGWRTVERFRRESIPVTTAWEQSIVRLAERIGVSRPVRLCQSLLVEVPTVIGWLRPVILVPTSTLVGLSPQQLEALLAHELAHIKRHDYIFNLLQSLAETLLFYHPAVWCVSAQMRGEREHACDDLAVAAMGGDALMYARALAELEGLRLSGEHSRLALAANDGSLLLRIRRLIKAPGRPRRTSFTLVVTIASISFLTILLTAQALLSQRAPQQRTQPTELVRPPRDQASRRSGDQAGTTDETLRREVAGHIAVDDVTGEDGAVRRAAVGALGERAGTVIVMNSRTGRVYTIVNQEWALRRNWSPASTIKLITALAGIEEKVFEPTEKLRIANANRRIDLADALAISSTSYFELVGKRVGFDLFMKYARRLGLGSPTGINYANESGGQLPSRESVTDVGRLCAYGDQVQVTPIQLARLASAIANRGALPIPHILRGDQTSPPEMQPQRSDISPETLRHISRGMTAVVERGTAQSARDPRQTVAGKTGTTTSRQGPNNLRVGLFTSYAPADDPRLVVVVVTQGSGESGSSAAAVAGEIYRALNKHL